MLYKGPLRLSLALLGDAVGIIDVIQLCDLIGQTVFPPFDAKTKQPVVYSCCFLVTAEGGSDVTGVYMG